MKYALIIGNDSYSDLKLAQLKTPAADSRALAMVLSDEKIGGFDEATPLINKTETEIRRAVSGFLANKRPDDLVLVYFSGHGVLDSRGRLFLALKDTQTSILTATAIPSTFIADEMDNCRSKRQILILDCCHSGAFARGTKAGEQKAVTEATFEGSGYGRVVLTASDSTQYALEGDQVISQTELSLFTHFLLEGLRTGEADSNDDGYVSLDEWYDYTYSQVLSTTPRQVPHKWSYHQQGDLIVAKNPYVVKKKLAERSSESANIYRRPITETAQPYKTKPRHQPSTAIIVALIVFAGIVIAGLLSSPLMGKWLSPEPFSTLSATPTRTVTPPATITFTVVSPTKTQRPSPTSTKTLVSNPIGFDPHPDSSDYLDAFAVPMRLVSAGEFWMGSDSSDNDILDQKPIRQVYLDDFYMDKYEVTNALYNVCVLSEVCAPPIGTLSDTRPNYYGNLITLQKG
jgi:uncharacterized caspase-like protein